MQPVDHSEFEDTARPTSFEEQIRTLYGDGAAAFKPLDMKVVLTLVGIGAASFWGGLLWLAFRMMAHHP